MAKLAITALVVVVLVVVGMIVYFASAGDNYKDIAISATSQSEPTNDLPTWNTTTGGGTPPPPGSPPPAPPQTIGTLSVLSTITKSDGTTEAISADTTIFAIFYDGVLVNQFAYQAEFTPTVPVQVRGALNTFLWVNVTGPLGSYRKTVQGVERTLAAGSRGLVMSGTLLPSEITLPDGGYTISFSLRLYLSYENVTHVQRNRAFVVSYPSIGVAKMTEQQEPGGGGSGHKYILSIVNVDQTPYVREE